MRRARERSANFAPLGGLSQVGGARSQAQAQAGLPRVVLRCESWSRRASGVVTITAELLPLLPA